MNSELRFGRARLKLPDERWCCGRRRDWWRWQNVRRRRGSRRRLIESIRGWSNAQPNPDAKREQNHRCQRRITNVHERKDYRFRLRQSSQFRFRQHERARLVAKFAEQRFELLNLFVRLT